MDAIKFSDKALSVFPMAYYFSTVKAFENASARRSAGKRSHRPPRQSSRKHKFLAAITSEAPPLGGASLYVECNQRSRARGAYSSSLAAKLLWSFAHRRS